MNFRKASARWKASVFHLAISLLVISCGSATLPTVAERAAGLPERGQWRNGFVLADMNGDQHLDVVHGAARKGRALPSIFLNSGSGVFSLWDEAHFPPLPYDYGDVAVGDLNGDSIPDLALSSHLRGLTVLIQESKGYFAPWANGLLLRRAGEFTDDRPLSSVAIDLADWDRDGRIDLVVLAEGPSISGRRAAGGFHVYLNHRGDWDRLNAPEEPFFGTSIATGDYDGDGRIDAITGSSAAGYVSVMKRSTGSGWVSEEVDVPPDALLTAVATQRRGNKDEALVAWLTRQGGRWTVGVDRLSRKRGAMVAAPLLREESTDEVTSIAVVRGAGQSPWLALLRSSGSITLLDRGRSQTIAAPPRYAGCRGYHLVAADLDHDGRPELVSSYAGEGTAADTAACSSNGGFAVWTVSAR